MSRKQEPASPSMASVAIAAILVFLLGGALGVLSLITRPVEVVSHVPEAEDFEPGMVYLVRGTRAGRTAWRQKEEAWMAGEVDSLSLSESELNQWSDNRLSRGPRPAGEESKLLGMELAVSPVNFRILNDAIQLSMVLEVDSPLGKKEIVYQVTGNFENTPEGVRFVARKGNLGRAPTAVLPAANSWLGGSLIQLLTASDDLQWVRESIAGLESAEIANDLLILRRRQAG